MAGSENDTNRVGFVRELDSRELQRGDFLAFNDVARTVVPGVGVGLEDVASFIDRLDAFHGWPDPFPPPTAPPCG